ncbi:MAG TPA: DNA topoisomerase III, partial [Spirochaetia bacterium]|nr:DNA topoisomerase III [Spirochaetia bacterium]
MKKIVLAEKPSVGKELGKIVGCSKRTKGYWEGNEYIVTWALGHLVELADPGEYDERYKTWSLDYLPMLPQPMKHKVIRRTSGQFRVIRELFKRKDVNHLIIATDAGREGELVARWIMRLGGWKGPVSRLWISSQTDSAIRDGFRNLRPGADYENLFRAAECRAEADWIIGINVTRALTCRHDARLSAGRVQTPTLAMIINREREIEAFTPESYWQIHADFGPFSGTWTGAGGETRIRDHARARSIADRVSGKEATLARVTKREKSELPPLAYDLTSLQRDANARCGFSAKKTLDTLQSLYERHKIVTYPRTDSRHITADIVPTLKDRLRAISASPYAALVRSLLASELKPGNRFVNDKKVSDHHAIIPTEQAVDLGKLDGDERALWNLVVQRFLAVLMRPHRYESTTLDLSVEGETFIARGTRVIERGWREAGGDSGESPPEDEQDGGDLDKEEPVRQDLSKYTEGLKFSVRKAEEKQGFTKPPPRYTEGMLVSAMENAGNLIEDKSLKSTIAGTGIGTPATRADIIEKLLDKYYIERRGKELIPTSRGFELLDLVPDELESPELTARWEQRLSHIAKGTEKAEAFSEDIRRNARELVDHIKRDTSQYRPRNLSSKSCPMCGKKMLPVRDKKGRKLLVCPSFSCGHEESEEGPDSFNRPP